MTAEHRLFSRQACRAIRMARSLLYYRAGSKNDEGMIEAINAYIAKNPKHGFGLLISSFKFEQQP
jgi:putative transposase